MKIKGVSRLKEQLCEFEEDTIAAITAELRRLGRTVTMDEFRFIPFREDIQPDVEAIRLDKEGAAVLDTSFTDVKEKHLSSFVSDNEIDHWYMIALLELLTDAPVWKPKKYFLKGKEGHPHIETTIDDLIPVPSPKRYNFNDLTKMIGCSRYEADWSEPMEEENDLLYDKHRDSNTDFFKIAGIDLIVIPGQYLYPTDLKETEIKGSIS